MEMIFKTLQLANILAGLLLLREAIPSFARWFKSRVMDSEKEVRVKKVTFYIGALSLGLLPILAFWRRLFDGRVHWLEIAEGLTNRIPANLSMFILFCLIFWFHHALCTARSSWRVQHWMMGVVLAVSIAATYMEMF